MKCTKCKKEITDKNKVKNGPYTYKKCRKCLNKIIGTINDKRSKAIKKAKWF